MRAIWKPAARITTAVVLFVVATFGRPVQATHHLITEGENWQQIAAKLKPGDEVVLLPGQHRPFTIVDAHGTAERPIVIRGADPNAPPLIDAERYGIRLLRPRHVKLENIQITGATINAIAIDGATAVGTAPDEPFGSVTLTSIVAARTGPHGQRHAILIDHVDHVTLSNCHVEAWAGSGIEIVASRDVRIESTTFIGREGYHQMSGVRVRAGSEDVSVDRCHFRATGDQGVCIGGGSKPEEFRAPPSGEAPPEVLFEAVRVRVARNVFEGGRCAVSFVHCAQTQVYQCTVLRPQRAVVSIRREQDDARFGPPEGCEFGNNLIVWKPGDIATLTHRSDDSLLDTIRLTENLWWTSDWADASESLLPFPGPSTFPQIVDVDPVLDEDGRPTVAMAEVFGHLAQ